MTSSRIRLAGAVACALAFAGVSLAGDLDIRQSGIVDAGIDPNCVTYDTAAEGSDTCVYFEQYWGISRQDFVRWVSDFRDTPGSFSSACPNLR